MPQSHMFDSGIPLLGDAHALLIGISTYENSEQIAEALGNIYCARTDAEDLKDTLLNVGYCGSNLHLLCDHDANMQAIRRELIALRQLEPRARLVFIFWASHGVFDQGRNYLLPWDADLDHLDRTALTLDELTESIFFINAVHIAVFLDTCYSKPGTNFARSFAQTELGRFRAHLPIKVCAFIGASTELAIETDEGGILATCLNAGLNGKWISDEAGIVHLGPLITYLQDVVRKEASMAWKRGRSNRANPQSPYFSFAYEGNDQVPIGLNFSKYLVHRVLTSAELPDPVKELAIRVIHKGWPGATHDDYDC